MPLPCDLARTTAPVWWARGRWPNADWRAGTLYWVGWEAGTVVWRAVRQESPTALSISGSGAPDCDAAWAAAVLGVEKTMPEFQVESLRTLAAAHRGMRPWAAGSLFEGVVSSVVGQSISVAAAAVTERRLYSLFNAPVIIDDRPFWAPPRADQLASADIDLVRTSGVTKKRAEALIEAGRHFTDGRLLEPGSKEFDGSLARKSLLAISGIGPWTERSAFLWGVADADSHPTGDVALLRAVTRHLPQVASLKELDQAAANWAPHRGWAARLFWLDLLGFDDGPPRAN